MNPALLEAPTVFRSGVAQKPITQAMLDEPHGPHNFNEYREVIEAVRGDEGNLHFWARYGLTRRLGRFCRHLNSSLRVSCRSIADDEFDIWLGFLRVAGPMLRELEQSPPDWAEFACKVQDFKGLGDILERSPVGDNLVYWARFGVFEGVASWVHMSEMNLRNPTMRVELEGVPHDPQSYIRDAALLIASHDPL